MPKFAITRKQLLVQELLELNKEAAAIEAKRQVMIAKLEKLGVDRVEGITHYANISHTTRTTLVPEKVRKLLTAAEYKKCERRTPVTTVRLYKL